MSASQNEVDGVPIEVGWSSQRLDLHDPKEDWTGLTNPVERRKLQNRLNQRARRTRVKKKSPSSTASQAATEVVASAHSKATSHETPINEDSQSEGDPSLRPPGDKTIAHAGCLSASPRVQELMRRFADHAYSSYMQGTPALSHLSLLVHFNLNCAMVRNAEMLGVVEEYYLWDGVSPLNKQGPSLGLTSSRGPIEWPPNLWPTSLQGSMTHHPWVDCFVWPRFRDNLLQAFEHPEICDEDELCHDLCEFSHDDGQQSFIVWGEAWDPHGWEVSLQFLEKWGWLLQGCPEVLQATNYWREKRGEKSLTVEEVRTAMFRSMPRQLKGSVLKDSEL